MKPSPSRLITLAFGTSDKSIAIPRAQLGIHNGPPSEDCRTMIVPPSLVNVKTASGSGSTKPLATTRNPDARAPKVSYGR